MKLLLTISTTAKVGDDSYIVPLQAFKVLTSDYNITTFFTTKSIKDKLNTEVEPQGSIRGQQVCDVQAMFDALEAHEHPLFDVLADGLPESEDYANALGYSPYEDIKYLMPKLNRSMKLRVLKAVTQDVSEQAWLPTSQVNRLIKKYGSKRKACSTSKRGFAIA